MSGLDNWLELSLVVNYLAEKMVELRTLLRQQQRVVEAQDDIIRGLHFELARMRNLVTVWEENYDGQLYLQAEHVEGGSDVDG